MRCAPWGSRVTWPPPYRAPTASRILSTRCPPGPGEHPPGGRYPVAVGERAQSQSAHSAAPVARSVATLIRTPEYPNLPILVERRGRQSRCCPTNGSVRADAWPERRGTERDAGCVPSVAAPPLLARVLPGIAGRGLGVDRFGRPRARTLALLPRLEGGVAAPLKLIAFRVRDRH